MTEANPGRGQNGQFIRVIDTAKRDHEAAGLRSLGQSYAQIAVQMGYADPSGSHRAVARALQATGGEATDTARRLELDRIDRWTSKAEAILDNPGVQVDRLGRPVLGTDGQPQLDRTVMLSAVERLARLSERRTRITGIEAPRRTMSITATLDAIPLEDIRAWLVQRSADARAEIEATEARIAIRGELEADDT